MKFLLLCAFLVILSSASWVQLAAAEDYNYLLSSFNYSVSIRSNFEEALFYYGEYFTQELEEISVRLTDRISVAVAQSGADGNRGERVQSCANATTHMIEEQVEEVQGEFDKIAVESNELHQAINQKIMQTNILTQPMDEFYYIFTQEMSEVYNQLNDQKLPNLRNSIVHLIAVGDLAFVILDSCLESIN